MMVRYNVSKNFHKNHMRYYVVGRGWGIYGGKGKLGIPNFTGDWILPINIQKHR